MSVDNGCLGIRMGSSVRRTGGQWPMDSRIEPSVIKLSRDASCNFGDPFLFRQHQRSSCATAMRQCANSSIYQSPRWAKFSSIKPCTVPMGSVSQPTGNLTAQHLPGIDNQQADRLSRLVSQYEWQLHPCLFRFIDKMLGPHSVVDRFAPIVSTQLPLYNSQYHGPNTSGVDALAQQNWGQHVNFVNCPFRLIPQVLDIIQTQEAEVTLIAPYWPGQPWFRRLKQISLEPPLRIPMKAVLPLCSIKPEALKNLVYQRSDYMYRH